MIFEGFWREKGFCSNVFKLFPFPKRKINLTGGPLCPVLLVPGPGEDKSIDHHFFDARSPFPQQLVFAWLTASTGLSAGWRNGPGRSCIKAPGPQATMERQHWGRKVRSAFWIWQHGRAHLHLLCFSFCSLLCVLHWTSPSAPPSSPRPPPYFPLSRSKIKQSSLIQGRSAPVGMLNRRPSSVIIWPPLCRTHYWISHF